MRYFKVVRVVAPLILGLALGVSPVLSGIGWAADRAGVRETAIRIVGQTILLRAPKIEVKSAPVAVTEKVTATSDLTSVSLVPSSKRPNAAVKVVKQAPYPSTPSEPEGKPVVAVSAKPDDVLAKDADTSAPPKVPADAVKIGIPKSPPVVKSEPVDPELYVLVLVGDTGLNAHNQRVRPEKATRHGRGYSWNWLTRRIEPLIDGDINFANIETVVTDRNRLRPSPKAFNFRMHPRGARHLVDIGFNVFSLANNHSVDYGPSGVRDTLRHSEKLRTAGLRGHAGLGVDRDQAIQSDTFSIGQTRFGFAAMGIGARSPGPSRAGVNKPGQVNIYGKEDFDAVVGNLVKAPVDYRILSMHFGAERNVRPLSGQVAKWRDDVQLGRGVDLIVGHHAHVVQGVQINDGKLIFYGLGNFLHLGMQDMGKFNACRDYGLLARVFVVRSPDGTIEAQAVQVVPLKDMHLQAYARTGKGAARRIDILNMLAEELDDKALGSHGVRFAKQKDGTGLYCRPGAENGPGRLGALCSGYTPAPALTKAQRGRLRSLCRLPSSRVTRTSSRSRARGTKRKRSRPKKVWRGRNVFNNR